MDFSGSSMAKILVIMQIVIKNKQLNTKLIPRAYMFAKETCLLRIVEVVWTLELNFCK